MIEPTDTIRSDAAAARTRIDAVLKRLPPRQRTAFWKAVNTCYAVVDLGPETGEATPRSGSAPGRASGSGS